MKHNLKDALTIRDWTSLHDYLLFLEEELEQLKHKMLIPENDALRNAFHGGKVQLIDEILGEKKDV